MTREGGEKKWRGTGAPLRGKVITCPQEIKGGGNGMHRRRGGGEKGAVLGGISMRKHPNVGSEAKGGRI